MNKKIPTIRDVAKAAGVSIATVSKYVNGAKRFSPAVEATIKGAIEELGYHSNPWARSMVTGKTKTVGVAILDISNPHFTSIVKGANRVAVAQGYTVLLVDTEESSNREQQLLEALARRVDGMIVSSRMPEAAIKAIVQIGKPVVYFGRLPPTLKLPGVGSDSYRGSLMLAQHLLAQGHRRLAYLGFSKSRWDRERKRGITECLEPHGLSLATFDTKAPTATEGERLCSTIMLTSERPDALICYNDLIAIGFIKEAQTLGFHLPADISVAGFDNITFGQYISPPLTTVDMQSERTGEVAMETLLDAMSGKDIESYICLEPRVILRSSTSNRIPQGKARNEG
ncbi:MAG TPA: LacI family DNA-binding transcriptional regulator [Polyangia bacterium]|nr:LacI family DNA-binding transcriptional regulator [Polyangia bacterium]